MGAIEDYFGANEWPKSSEEARNVKPIVDQWRAEQANKARCKRLLTLIRQAEFEARAGRYEEAVTKLKQATQGATT